MHGYAAPALETVRAGLVGMGSRGSGMARRLAGVEGVEIKALCDIVPERVHETIEAISGFPQHDPDVYADGPEDWKRMCEREDIDLIYIATPWHLHGEQCIFSMEHDKHVYVEIPAATSIEQCWELVETSERTRKHCALMSASCHSGLNAVTLNMARKGFFGDLVHAEGNYVHDRVSNPNPMAVVIRITITGSVTAPGGWMKILHGMGICILSTGWFRYRRCFSLTTGIRWTIWYRCPAMILRWPR
jgi:predicted dehydrogenase